ncbi:hypothetical protein [Methanoregula sp.]|uniref:hypothetical protein n=1 Tax=Methanoregula sp. TaxID=2052170 RepID=UPI002606C7D0|nr:hypothetical protein [Methanoregula sp.]MDD5142810.1 hypothetical protein [Methanoregula sp.]
MVTDLVQTALSVVDGAGFTTLEQCPHCGGPVTGYDTRQKKFAVVLDGDEERTLTVRVKRFTCRSCGRLCYSDEPFYPGTRIGSPVIDFYLTKSLIMPSSQAARVIAAMGIVVDRTTWKNYRDRAMPEVPQADFFGMLLPRSILSLSALAAKGPAGDRITGRDILAACGWPSRWGRAGGMIRDTPGFWGNPTVTPW